MTGTIRCSATGCEGEAKWQVCARAWAVGHTKEGSGPLLMQSSMMLCDEHKEKPHVAAAEMFTPEARKMIQDALMKHGKAPINFDTCEFVFAPITPEKAEQLSRHVIDNDMPRELLEGLPMPKSILALWESFEQQCLKSLTAKVAAARDGSDEELRQFTANLHQLAMMCFISGASAISGHWAIAERKESDEQRKQMANRLHKEGLGLLLMHSLGGQVAHA